MLNGLYQHYTMYVVVMYEIVVPKMPSNPQRHPQANTSTKGLTHYYSWNVLFFNKQTIFNRIINHGTYNLLHDILYTHTGSTCGNRII